jgi:hypothetical protein
LKKIGTETNSLEEFTCHSLIEENSSVTESAEVLVLMSQHIEKLVAEEHPFAHLVCQLYGWFGQPIVHKDLTDYLIQVYYQLCNSTSQQQVPLSSKSLAECVSFTKKFFSANQSLATKVFE